MKIDDSTPKIHNVKVVTPLYSEELSDLEYKALLNNFAKLSAYIHVILKPKSVDVTSITKKLPKHEVIEVSDEWLGTKNGIAGYNKMLLNKSFYQLFADCEYILICHTDAWIFRDELEEWCNKDYDCVAASWVRRKVYDLPIISTFMYLKRKFTHKEGRITKEDIYNKVGNGGLSLRRVDAFILACDTYADVICHFLQRHHHLFNEDVFWAIIPTHFKYPKLQEALAFSFDTHPKYCLNSRNGELPFGCHAWTKPRYYKFWKNYIL